MKFILNCSNLRSCDDCGDHHEFSCALDGLSSFSSHSHHSLYDDRFRVVEDSRVFGYVDILIIVANSVCLQHCMCSSQLVAKSFSIPTIRFGAASSSSGLPTAFGLSCRSPYSLRSGLDSPPTLTRIFTRPLPTPTYQLRCRLQPTFTTKTAFTPLKKASSRLLKPKTISFHLI